MSNITKFHKDGSLPTNNEIFVFGSNLAGRHGAGAARVAFEMFGAPYGLGVGIYNDSYAIPTKDEELKTLSLEDIKVHVQAFLAVARNNLDIEFFVTAVGCGLAGYRNDQIAPMFAGAPGNCNLPDVWEAYL